MQPPPPQATPAPLRRESLNIDPLAAIPPSIPITQPISTIPPSLPPKVFNPGADVRINQINQNPDNYAQTQTVAPVNTNNDVPYSNNMSSMSNVQKVPVIQTPLLLPQQTASPVATLEKLSTAFLTKCVVTPLNLTKIPKNLNGLDILVQCNAWKYCVDLLEPMITSMVLTHLLTHSLTYSPTHLLTHSPTHSLRVWAMPLGHQIY
jgi:hypothetical protein